MKYIDKLNSELVTVVDVIGGDVVKIINDGTRTITLATREELAENFEQVYMAKFETIGAKVGREVVYFSKNEMVTLNEIDDDIVFVKEYVLGAVTLIAIPTEQFFACFEEVE